jgi:hypothetical protein
MGLGPLHTVSLAEARLEAEKCRKQLREGIDPIDHRNALKAARRLEGVQFMSFRECAEAYIRSHGAAWGRLSWDIGIRSLEKYRSDYAVDLNCREARNAHKKIRDAINLYRLAHGTTNARGKPKISGPQTRTRIIEAVKKVKVNAAGVVRSNCEEKWLNRLADALSVKANLLADLHYAVIRQGIDIWNLKSRISRC